MPSATSAARITQAYLSWTLSLLAVVGCASGCGPTCSIVSPDVTRSAPRLKARGAPWCCDKDVQLDYVQSASPGGVLSASLQKTLPWMPPALSLSNVYTVPSSLVFVALEAQPAASLCSSVRVTFSEELK